MRECSLLTSVGTGEMRMGDYILIQIKWMPIKLKKTGRIPPLAYISLICLDSESEICLFL